MPKAKRPPAPTDFSDHARLWRAGELRFLLNPTQRGMWADLKAMEKEPQVVVLARRQLGKSHLLLAWVIAYAITHPNAQIKYLCKTRKMAKNFLLPISRKILARDCPADVRPEWNNQESMWKFLNGSEILLQGMDGGGVERLRGQTAHTLVWDEAGFSSAADFDEMVEDVLISMFATTRGQIILASSAPKSPGHPFVREVRKARAAKRIIERSIHDTVRTTPEEERDFQETYKDLLARFGGSTESIRWKRNMLNELELTETSRAIFPVWNKALEAKLVKEFKRPDYFHAQVAADWGFSRHATAILFGYLDWETRKIIIEDELFGYRWTSDKVAKVVKEKELALWNGKKVHSRFCDVEPLMVAELEESGIEFCQSRNDELDAQINAVSDLLEKERIIINPRCVKLIGSLHAGVWKGTNRTTWDECEEYGHYDPLAALLFLCRNIEMFENPTPKALDLFDKLNGYTSAEDKAWSEVFPKSTI